MIAQTELLSLLGCRDIKTFWKSVKTCLFLSFCELSSNRPIQAPKKWEKDDAPPAKTCRWVPAQQTMTYVGGSVVKVIYKTTPTIQKPKKMILKHKNLS